MFQIEINPRSHGYKALSAQEREAISFSTI